jgi:hypothetical protein
MKLAVDEVRLVKEAVRRLRDMTPSVFGEAGRKSPSAKYLKLVSLADRIEMVAEIEVS